MHVVGMKQVGMRHVLCVSEKRVRQKKREYHRYGSNKTNEPEIVSYRV
jgi:hypothetical protein